MNRKNYLSAITAISSPAEFNKLALEAFRFQSARNEVYRRFINALGIDARSVVSAGEIPFLPVEFFKTHLVTSAETAGMSRFTSSGTGGERSAHYVDPVLYENIFTESFRLFYGNPQSYNFFALLPSYLEREGSSLVYMANSLISKSTGGGFYLDEYEALEKALTHAGGNGRKTILLGVTFALIDFASECSRAFPDLIVMETGGMKGRRREMIREEVHAILKEKLGVPCVHSEYGMTELLSQAYSVAGGLFRCPPWMKITIRDPYDPLTAAPAGSTGGINITDLANIDSCCFLSVQDLGRLHDDGSFEVLGRFDFSDLRGCNLLVS